LVTVALPPELEAFVQQKVESGRYFSAGEVVLEALRLLEVQDRMQSTQRELLRKEIAIGIEQADRGELQDGPSVFERLGERIESMDGSTP
jgi:antitoxin ParD1/3/4